MRHKSHMAVITRAASKPTANKPTNSVINTLWWRDCSENNAQLSLTFAFNSWFGINELFLASLPMNQNTQNSREPTIFSFMELSLQYVRNIWTMIVWKINFYSNLCRIELFVFFYFLNVCLNVSGVLKYSTDNTFMILQIQLFLIFISSYKWITDENSVVNTH